MGAGRRRAGQLRRGGEQTKRLRLQPLEPRILLSSGGVLAADAVWNGLVELDARLTIESGVTLTVEPGTVVKAHEGTAITCLGTLDAHGTQAEPIIFTSIRDDSIGGDTNGDGLSVGQQGDWDGLRLVAAEGISLEHVEIRYAGVSALGSAVREAQPATEPLGAAAFPTPLDALSPAGSLIHAGSTTDSLASAADDDQFALAIDAGQTVSVRVTPLNPLLQPHVELLDPADTSLGTASAPGAGDTAILQLVGTTAAGEYEIHVSSMVGSGDYEIEVVLNAAIEEEPWGGAPNDTPSAASDIRDSELDMQDGATRLGVVGQLNGTDDLFAFDLAAGDTLAMGLFAEGGDEPFRGTEFDAGGPCTFLALADLNGDGRDDAIVVSRDYENDQGDWIAGSVQTLLNQGDGTFGAPSVTVFDTRIDALAVGEVTGDSHLDVVVATLDDNQWPPLSQLQVLPGDGTGALGGPIVVPTTGMVRGLAVGNMDGANALDIVVVEYDDGSITGNPLSAVRVVLSDGAGGFDEGSWADLLFPEPGPVVLGDLDGGGTTDVVVSNGGEGWAYTSVSVFAGNGDGTLGGERVEFVGHVPIGMALGHLDDDNFLDLVTANVADTVGNDAQSISVLLNAGDGSFGTATTYALADHKPSAVAIGDLDGDTVADLAVAALGDWGDWATGVTLLRGVGQGSFETWRDAATDFGPKAVSIADLDGDGTLDLVTGNRGDSGGESVSTLSVLTNPPPVTLELLDPAGNPLAQGLDEGWDTLDEAIGGLVVPSTGTYTARVSGGADGQDYALVVTIGAEFELPPEPDGPPVPQDITASGQVVGRLAGEPGQDTIPHVGEDFESGALNGAWSTWSSDPRGRIQVTDAGGTHGGDFALLMDAEFESGGDLVLNEAIWTVDLSDQSGATLSFWHAEFRETHHAFAGDFADHANADGIAISDDGVTWHPVWNGADQEDDQWLLYSVDIGAEATAAGMTLGAGFQIKFQQYDGRDIPWDGRAWDDIALTVPGDAYTIQVNQNDAIAATVQTPGDGPGQPPNTLAPQLVLLDETGTQVTTDVGGTLTANAASSGTYTLIVRPTSGAGDYTLAVAGASGLVLGAFEVDTSDPPDGATLAGFPASLTVDFSQPVLLTTVDASDLVITGPGGPGQAAGVRVHDGALLSFDIAGQESGDGTYTVSLAAGALTSVSGQPLEAFAASFDADVTLPTVIGSSLSDGDVLPPGDVAAMVQFSEPLDEADFDGDDVWLVDQTSGSAYLASWGMFDYDGTTSTLNVVFQNVAEGGYTLYVTTSDTAAHDAGGNLLDGDGDGRAGDPFTVSLGVDGADEPFATPLAERVPRGGLVYSGHVWGRAFHDAGDDDTFAIDLDAGQRVSVVLEPEQGGFAGQLELFDPLGTSLGTAAAGPGDPVVLQGIEAAGAGTYSVVASSTSGTGSYDIELITNALYEAEAYGGLDNGFAAAAENIAASVTALDSMGTHYAVCGALEDNLGAPAADVFVLDLTAGDVLSAGIGGTLDLTLIDATDIEIARAVQTNTDGFSRTLNSYLVPASGSYHLRVSSDGSASGDYTLVVAVDAVLDAEPNDTPDHAQPLQLVTGALGHLSAAPYDVEPDDFDYGAELADAVPGVTLSVDGQDPDDFKVRVFRSDDAPTGTRVFGYTAYVINSYSTWTRDREWLRADFDQPVASVSIDIVPVADNDDGYLRAYDAGGNLLRSVRSSMWGVAGQAETVCIVRPQTDIAYITASGNSADEVLLDNLVVGLDDADAYAFDVASGDTVTVAATVPYSEPNEPPNALTPQLTVYDEAGDPVALDGTGSFTAGTAGTHVVEVGGDGVTQGSYVLSVAGASPATNPAPFVEASTPADGGRVQHMPASIDLVFSEGLRDLAPAASAFTVNGTPATMVEFLDGRTARFTIGLPDDEGDYAWTLAAGSFTDLQGLTNAEQTGTFAIDRTGPHVVAHDIEVINTPTGIGFDHITFEFDEAIAPDSVWTTDVTEFRGPSNQNLRSHLHEPTIAGNLVTFPFDVRTEIGAYTFTIGPEIEDLAANEMDQDLNGTPGETGDSYTAVIGLTGPDLTLDDTVALDPTAAQFGDEIEVEWTVRNAGDGDAAEAWHYKVYISDNDVLNWDDLEAAQVASDATLPLGPGDTHTQSAIVQLPLGAWSTDGTWYVIVEADWNDRVAELDEGNNDDAAAIALTVPLLPDLEVTAADLGEHIVVLGESYDATWTTTNHGPGTAQFKWFDRLYLSADDQFVAADDTLVYSYFAGAHSPLASGGDYEPTDSVMIPWHWPVGNAYLLFVTDEFDDQFEGDETNNVAAVAIEVRAPDLVTDWVEVTEASAEFGQPVTVRWQVRNTGNSDALAGWHAGVRLSTDDQWDNDDWLATTIESSAPTLAPGDTHVQDATFTLPLDTQCADGQFHVLVKADGRGDVVEADEDNNVASDIIDLTLPPLPDLVVTDIDAPLAAFTGEDVLVQWTLTNNGGGAATGTWTDRLRLAGCADPFGLGCSTMLDLGAFGFTGTVDAGQAIVRTETVTIPRDAADTSPAPWWLTVETNVDYGVYEHDADGNNATVDDAQVVVSPAPSPRLQMTDLTPPVGAASGQDVVVSWEVTNTGDAATTDPVWRDWIYLSSDDVYSDGDVPLGSAVNPLYLNPGDTYTNQMTVTLPQGFEGDYTLFGFAGKPPGVLLPGSPPPAHMYMSDPFPITLTPPPDLQVTLVDAPAQAFSGQKMSLAWTVTNQGTGSTVTDAWSDRVWMASDPDGGGDIYDFGVVAHQGALPNQGDSYVATKEITLPVGVSGDFYFFVDVDIPGFWGVTWGNVFEHIFEDNNVGHDATATTVNLTPPPDLEVLAVDAPDAAVANHLIDIHYTIANLGATATPESAWLDRLYLSDDATLDTDTDLLLAERDHIGKLQPGDERHDTFSVRLPDDLDGTFSVFVLTDAHQDVFELDYDNNFAADPEPMTVDIVRPDLVVADIQVDSPILVGTAAPVAFTILNQGLGDTAGTTWNDGLFLSPDATLDMDTDLKLDCQCNGAHTLANGDTLVRSALIELPDDLAAGDYHLFAVADGLGKLTESVEDNNTDSRVVTVVNPAPDLQVAAITAPGAATAGDQVTIDWTVQNLGLGATVADEWDDRVVLSANPTLGDADDIVLGARFHVGRLDGFGGGTPDEYPGSLTTQLPRTLAGDFHVFVVTDWRDSVYEGPHEGNNALEAPGLLSVAPLPPIDLVMADVDGPDTLVGGQPIEVTFTVRNAGGPGVESERPWCDSVYLSRDQALDTSRDTYLGYVNFEDPTPGDPGLASGADYTVTETFDTAPGLSGTYYVFALADGGEDVPEADEVNNISFDPSPVAISLPEPVDMVVGPITLPANGALGADATITYTVENDSDTAIPGIGWEDSLYISADQVWDISDAFFAREHVGGPVPAHGTYNNAVTAPLPGVLPGDYFVILRTDVVNRVPEGNEANNIGASLDDFALDAPTLVLGTPDTGLVETSNSLYYRLDVPQGESVRVLFDDPSDDAFNQLFVAHGRIPTSGDYDTRQTDPLVADPELTFAAEQGGTYYVLAQCIYRDGQDTYSISADIVPFAVASVESQVVGNWGRATVEVAGSRFEQGMAFAIVGPHGDAHQAIKVEVADSTRAYATFELLDDPVGIYDLEAELPDGTTAALDDAFKVIESGGAEYYVEIDVPPTMLLGRYYTCRIDYGNIGDQDGAAALGLVTIDGIKWGQVQQDGDRVPMPTGFSPDYMSAGQPLHVLFTSREGAIDTLRPGELGVASLEFYTLPDVGPASRLESHVEILDTSIATPIDDWDAIEDAIRPDGMRWVHSADELQPGGLDNALTTEQWDAFWAQIQPHIGTTWGQYIAFLNDVAARLDGIYPATNDPRQLLANMYEHDPNYVPTGGITGTLVLATDASPVGPGEIFAYRVRADGELELAAGGTIAADGTFLIPYLSPGTYELGVDDVGFDMDRDGALDMATPRITVPENSDADAGTLYVHVGPDVPIEERTPVVTLDGSGTPHILYSSDQQVWHAWYNGTDWVGAQVVATEPGFHLSLAASPDLFGAGQEGLIATWSQGADNDEEVVYSVGRPDGQGGYEWAEPVALTNNAVQDSAPVLIVTDAGDPLIVHTIEDHDVQDDTDYYYDLLDLTEGAFTWPQLLAAAGLEGDVPLEPTAFQLTYTKDWDIGARMGLSVAAGFEINVKINEDEEKCTAAGQGEAKGYIERKNTVSGVGVKVSGLGFLSTEWEVDGCVCRYEWAKGKMGGGAEAEFKFDGMLTRFLDGLAPGVGSAVGSAIWAVNAYTPMSISEGVMIGLGLMYEGSWSTADDPPYPSFTMPGKIEKFVVSGKAGPYVTFDAGIVGGVQFELAGEASLAIQVLPSVKLDGWSVDLKCSAQFGWFKFEKSWKLAGSTLPDGSFVATELVAASDDPFEGWTTTFDPDGFLGTTNVYAANPVMASVGSDQVHDADAGLAKDQNGDIFMAWSRDDVTAAQMGSKIVVADFDGAAWATTEDIPGSHGFHHSVTPTVDQNNTRMVLWGHADASGVTASSTMQEVFEARDANDIVYSVYDGSDWSAPTFLATTPGKDAAITTAIGPDGVLRAAWVTANADDTFSILLAEWDGSAWSAPVEVVRGHNLDCPNLTTLNGQLALLFVQDTDPGTEDDEVECHIFATAFDGSQWSTTEQISPTTIYGVPLTETVQEGTGEPIRPTGLLPTPSNSSGCCALDCGPLPGGDDWDGGSFLSPIDPNEIHGPAGYGDDHWVPADQPLDYTIFFENDPEQATAPAQEVTITQQLDPDLDVRTFRVGDFGWGDVFVDVPEGQAFYYDRLDLTAAHGFYVDVAAGVDVATGQAFWNFTTIDPATGQKPLDPAMGFLPPNTQDDIGQGFARYAIKADRDATTGTVVDALASIVFDINEPLDTPPIFNTLDADAPTSAVAALPATVPDPEFPVAWGGADQANGSGVGTYDVYVARDDGSYSLWMDATTAAAATYTGLSGHTYAFYAVATDNAGNVEDEPGVPDAVTVTPGATAAIGDFVWLDADADGIQDPSELGIPDVTVNLYTGAALLDTTTTDAAGHYRFDGLDPTLEYQVEVIPPAGHLFSPLGSGQDDTDDSDIDPATGRTAAFAVEAWDNLQWDAGLYQPATIQGVVWDDANGNGEMDGDEVGLANWRVFLDDDHDGEWDDPEETSTVSDADGRYEFTGLTPGDYTIAEVVETGWTQTYPGPAGVADVAAIGNRAWAYTTAASPVQIYAPGQVMADTGSTEAEALIGLDDYRADPQLAAYDGSGTSIVIIDTGIDLDHDLFGPDADGDGVADRIVYSYDFADHDADASDAHGHGSNVSSIAAAVAPGADIIHLKVFSDEGEGYFSYAERALQWVVRNADAYHIAAVNLSFGDGNNWAMAGGQYGVADELATLAAQGVLVIASAGNSFAPFGCVLGVAYPAADPNVVAVGAVWDSDRGGPWDFGAYGTDYTTNADRITAFSQRHGTLTDGFAPGALITGANATGGTATMRGTSQAAPFVAGTAALAQQIARDQLGRALTTHEFRTLLDTTGEPIVDGDDEDDSVVNTGLTYARLDVHALAQTIATLDPDNPDYGPNDPGSGAGDTDTQLHTQPFAHTVRLSSGDSRDDIDFGNQSQLVPAPTDLAIVPDTGTPDDGVTNTGDVTLTGSLGETGLTVHLYDETTGADLGDAIVDGTSFSADLTLAAGDHRLRAIADDGQGNTSGPAFLDVVVDIAAPEGALSSPAAGSTINTDPGYVEVQWADAGPAGLDTTSFGTADITVSGVAITDAQHLGGGLVRYSYTGSLADGQVDVTLVGGEVSDLAGSINAQTTESFDYDGTAPTATGVTLTDDTGVPGDALTADAAPVLTFEFSEPVLGTAADVSVAGPAGPVTNYTVAGFGSDTLTVTFTSDLTNDGLYTVTLDGTGTITDAAGNPLNGGADETAQFTLDTQAPDGILTTPTPGLATQTDLGYVEVLWTDGHLDEASCGIDDITITGVTVTGHEHRGGGLVRYTYSGSLQPGQVDVTLQAGTVVDLAGNASAEATRSFTFAPPVEDGPVLVGTQVDDGHIQRSMVRSFAATFDKDVTVGAGALVLAGPSAVATRLATYDGGTFTAIWEFDANGDGTFGDTLPDGDWAARVVCALVTDGDGTALQDTDATPGDGILLAATFHRLFGDVDGDRDVDGADYQSFRIAYAWWVRNGQQSPLFTYFDSDQDGDVDAADFAAFRNRYGSSM